MKENLIHIRFDYEDALSSKKDLISLEMNLVKVSKTLRNYKQTCLKELALKQKLKIKARAIKLDLGRLTNLLPKPKIPKVLKKNYELKKAEQEVQEIEIKKETGDDLDNQLREIQERLKALSK